MVFLLRTIFVHAPGQGTIQELFLSKYKGEPYMPRAARATYSSSLGETQIPFIQYTFVNAFFPKGIAIREDHCLSPFSATISRNTQLVFALSVELGEANFLI